MAKESPLYEERLALVDTPDEYYIIVAFIDLFEFIFYPYKTKMINEKLCFIKMDSSCNGNEYMPKFEAIWNKTKQVHTVDFIEFMNSLSIF
jgi:hypothetical protein